MSNKLFPIIPRRGDLFRVFGPDNSADIDSIFSLFDLSRDRNAYSTKGFRETSSFFPKANISKTAAGFKIELAAPGLSRADFNINVEDSVLTISSQVENDSKDENENYTSCEFSQSSFSRSWTLPDTVNTKVITARYEAGILYLDIPSTEKASESLVINVD